MLCFYITITFDFLKNQKTYTTIWEKKPEKVAKARGENRKRGKAQDLICDVLSQPFEIKKEKKEDGKGRKNLVKDGLQGEEGGTQMKERTADKELGL